MSYRLAIALRVLAAIVGGYALAALVTFALAKVLPMSRSEASLTATLLSFLVYACLAIWVFAKRKPEGFRQAMAWLHTWSGLVVGWILFAVFVTGTLSYFRPEISHWMRPELRDAQAVPGAVARVIPTLQQRAPNSPRWFIRPPTPREPVVRASWTNSAADQANGKRRFETAVFDAATGAELQSRDTKGGEFLYRFHFELSMKPIWGRWVVGFCAMFMLVAIISGVVTHKKIFKDFFTFRPNKGQRSWLDAHNAVGVLALPYHVMITYTGLITLMFMYMPWGVKANYGADSQTFFAEALDFAPATKPANVPGTLSRIEPMLQEAARRWDGASPALIAVHQPGDANSRVEFRRDDRGRLSHSSQTLLFEGVSGKLISAAGDEPPAAQTRNVLYGLHIAHFSSSTLRWMFALSGLAGILMVASGLVLWSVKRAPERARLGRTPLGHRLVEILNIGAIAGLPSAIAAYFWANRLVPVGISERAGWEVRIFFVAWLLSLAGAVLQPARSAWRTQFTMAALLFALLPALNALTTDTHLGETLARGNWVYAGFDLTMLGLGALLAVVAWHTGRAPGNLAKPRKKPLESRMMGAEVEQA